MAAVAVFLILSLQGVGVGPGNELHRALFPALADAGTVPGDWEGPGKKELAEQVAAGKRLAAIDERIEVYRNIARALGDYLTGDLIGSIDSMRLAERAAPEIVIVHVYLGSFYYLVSQPQRAMAQWKIALRLDPENAELRQAVHGAEVGLGD